MEWKYKAPIFIDDTIRVQADVVNRRAIKSLGGGVVVFKVQVLNQEDKVVQEGKWSVLMKSEAGAE
jgi:acyl dehydratase